LISKQAIKRFLNAPRDDHRYLKEFSHKQLDALLYKLDPQFKPYPKMGLHQKVGLYLGVLLGTFAFFYDMGTGKTLLSLELLQYWWDTGQLRRALVFVTSDKAYPTWERQLKQYKITVPYCILDSGSSEGKWKTLRHFDEGIIFLHYPGAVAMVSGPSTSKSKRKKHKLALVPKLVDQLLRDVDVVVFDEVTKASNIASLTYLLCRKASRAAKYRYALAGMPFGRDPTPLWSQMYLVDQGATLGETIGLFREAFFNEADNYWGGPFSKKYKFKPHLTDTLSTMVQHNSLTYTAGECIDLPPVVRIPELIKLPAEIKAYYKELVAEMIAARGNKRVMENAFLRMRQLSSGFIGLKDDETGERAEIEFDVNPKLERLLDILSVLPENRKALIFYQYTVSGRRIAETLKKEFKVKPIWLWSGTKKSAEEMRRFIEDESCPYAVINNQVGAYSLDGLQVANYEFFFESPLSVIDRSQAEKRIIRQGQLHKKCFLYDLVVQGTVDERILEFHVEGRDLFKALLADPARVLRGLG
jgi:SNF2 family DNA or RNA helicase